MTREEFDERIKKLDAIFAKYETVFSQCKAEIDELRSAKVEDEPPTPPHLRPYLEDDQNYFFINAAGKIEKTKWLSDRFDLGAREIGNVFMGETAAEFYAERLTVLAEMNEWAGGWDDCYRLTYHAKSDKVICVPTLGMQMYGEMRFYDRKDAEGCIKAVGEDRIKKYYFMIPEEEAQSD